MFSEGTELPELLLIAAAQTEPIVATTTTAARIRLTFAFLSNTELIDKAPVSAVFCFFLQNNTTYVNS
jgi:hypothetical protein